MRALSFGRLLGYDGSKGFVRMDRSLSRLRPVLPEIVLASLLILWAAAMVVTVPIIIMVLIFQRRIVAGLTAGAVKG